MIKPKRQLLGYCGVDSGQILLTDPCYIDSEWQHKSFKANFTEKEKQKCTGEFSYRGACLASLGEKQGGQLNFKKGHYGAGVCVSTAWGDGCYPVYANYDKDGRVSSVTIVF